MIWQLSAAYEAESYALFIKFFDELKRFVGQYPLRRKQGTALYIRAGAWEKRAADKWKRRQLLSSLKTFALILRF